MKNSAWYHKLWSKKFDSLPIKDAADASWAGMHKLLNEQLPAGTVGGNPPGISAGAKLFKIIGYAFSAAVTVSTVVYVTVPHSKNPKKEIVKENKVLRSDSALIDSSKVENYSNFADSNLINNTDTLNNLTVQNENADSSRIAEQKKQTVTGGTKEDRTTVIAGLHAVPTPVDRNKNVQETERNGIVLNPENTQSKYPAVLDVHFLFKKGKPELMAPGKFWQKNIFKGDSVNQVKNLSALRPVLEVYPADNSFRTAGASKGRDKNKSTGSSTEKNKKAKAIKPSKIKIPKTPKQSNEGDEPKYSYGITAGMNLQKGSTGFYGGAFGNYALNKKWGLAMGVNVNSKQKVAGEFTHPSYYKPDSVPPFTMADERKVMTVDIPLAAVYKLSKKLSIKAGPVIAFTIKQSDVLTKLKPLNDRRDTINHSAEVNTALSNTVSNRVSVGFIGGVSFHLKQFDINGSYQWLKPYNINNSLGGYQPNNQFFKIGVGYRLK
ncbi:outer membrane beta-barrel protein [Pedobacter sp. UBA5917]|jgi:hypothetical protein|uniref:outer membrane beta-barrel protein n=1 Tax=Pedobacter sp. UBA5917 TaxID=1947061 RepID=UPI0025E54F87|nr:outer membrane beta-barrel protein [Pedobacter sp. UBA5917]